MKLGLVTVKALQNRQQSFLSNIHIKYYQNEIIIITYCHYGTKHKMFHAKDALTQNVFLKKKLKEQSYSAKIKILQLSIWKT